MFDSTSAAGDRELRVRAERIDDQDKLNLVQTEPAAIAELDDPDEINIYDVGPSWGQQVSTKALRGLIVFLVLVSLYISVRFEWKMAVGALAAMFLDLLAIRSFLAV